MSRHLGLQRLQFSTMLTQGCYMNLKFSDFLNELRIKCIESAFFSSILLQLFRRFAVLNSMWGRQPADNLCPRKKYLRQIQATLRRGFAPKLNSIKFWGRFSNSVSLRTIFFPDSPSTHSILMLIRIPRKILHNMIYCQCIGLHIIWY